MAGRRILVQDRLFGILTLTKLFRVYKNIDIFDNGAALFSDIKMSYPLTMSIDECIDVVKAKPFSPCFEDQVSAAREVYGRQFSHKITEHDLEEVIKNVRKYGLYSKEIVDRVEAVIKKD